MCTYIGRLMCAAAVTAGCGGNAPSGADDAGTDSSGETDAVDESSGGDTESSPGACAGALSEDAAPLRRLTHWEYNNTIRDLLGDGSAPAGAFTGATAATGFDNNAAGLGVAAMLAEDYMRAAEDIAATAVQDLSTLLPCTPADEGPATCGAMFIDTVGSRAYRHPLSDAERAPLVALFEASRDAYGFEKAIELVLAAMLQSPSFLYRVELGAESDGGGGPVRLSDYEVASRLSYFLWGSMPDASLFEAAADGALGSAADVRAQAERMLADPKARAVVANFNRQWLRLDTLETISKDTAVYPDFDPELKASMKAETLTFLEDVVFDGRGDLDAMLRADYSFVDGALAQLYGVDGPSGDTLQRIELDPQRRSGLLTHASILATTGKPDQSSPVLRGKFVRERLLCESLPEPPPDVDTTPPAVDPGASTRERFGQHSRDPSCSPCHALIDPIGFGFEHYDGIGRWRATDGGVAVDASGEVVGNGGLEGTFDGVGELSDMLADSDQVRGCFVDTWFTYAQGRAPGDGDACTTSELATVFAESEGDVQALLLALTQTEAFLYRPARAGE